MISTLTQEQMLTLWRLSRAFEPLRPDCTVTRTDGIDLDTLLSRQMRGWYLNLLDTAPLEYLQLTDIAPTVAVEYNADGSIYVGLPPTCRRVVEVKMAEWERPAIIVDDPASPLALRQHSPYLRAGLAAPVAVVEKKRLHLYGATLSELERLLIVAEPPSDTYIFDTRALELIIPENSEIV